MAITCFHCGTSSEIESSGGLARIGFRDSCAKCLTDLHVCRNCIHYDEGAHHECREPQAEWVRNKERANICEYFKPGGKPGEDTRSQSSKQKQLAALDDLFKK